MTDCRVMIRASLEEVKALFQEYEDIEFSMKGDWTCAQENINAEFVHIKDGACLRAYQEYDGEVDTDEGDDPDTSISEWADVADYIDEHMS